MSEPVDGPVRITVDAVFDHLRAALDEAVEKNGNKAKSIAWDVSGYFIRELGSSRSTPQGHRP